MRTARFMIIVILALSLQNNHDPVVKVINLNLNINYLRSVEYIELENGNHHMSIEGNRLKVLTSFERFLNAHIPVSKN
jgi:hypothetical protein